jgi:hypothetical protein
MSKKNVLFAGCSFTANSGFLNENIPKYHWPSLLSRHYYAQQTNIAIGGCSNEEIFFRTTENIINNRYDLAVIMWSSLGRHWIYCNDQNIDDFTNINGGIPLGFNKDSPSVTEYAKLHCAYFNNQYMNLKKWLLHCISLARVAEHHNQKYIFVLGFNNLIEQFINIKYVNNGFENISNQCKQILDFDNRQDDYILSKITVIQNLLDQVKELNWVDFNSAGFHDTAVDLSDDHSHPGIQSNHALYKQIVTYIDKNSFL